MTRKKFFLLLGIGTFLFSGISCESSENIEAKSFFSKELLRDFGIGGLKAPTCDSNFSVIETDELNYCSFSATADYYWEYTKSVYYFLKYELNVENVYFLIDQAHINETNSREVTHYYLYKSDDMLDYVQERYFYNYPSEFYTTSFYYSLKKDTTNIYNVSLFQESVEQNDNKKRGIRMMLQKKNYYNVIQETDNKGIYELYSILNENEVTKININKENYKDYIDIKLTEKENKEQLKEIDVSIKTKENTYSNATFKFDFFDGEENVETEIIRQNGIKGSYAFYFPLDSEVHSSDVQISLYQEGDLYIYHKMIE